MVLLYFGQFLPKRLVFMNTDNDVYTFNLGFNYPVVVSLTLLQLRKWIVFYQTLFHNIQFFDENHIPMALALSVLYTDAIFLF